MSRHRNSFDLIIDTISAPHDVNALIGLLGRDKTLVQLGMPAEPLGIFVLGLGMGRKRLASSIIGGLRETQEMLDFCAAHQVTCDVEQIAIQQVNDAFERVLRNDVKYRFVIDLASLRG
jgi:alcohol dehydrogenase (NADP+)